MPINFAYVIQPQMLCFIIHLSLCEDLSLCTSLVNLMQLLSPTSTNQNKMIEPRSIITYFLTWTFFKQSLNCYAYYARVVV